LTLLVVEQLLKRFGGLAATDNFDLTVETGEIHAVIGPNGAGKTTLINQLSGEIHPDAGCILFQGVDITRTPAHRRSLLGISRSYQITSVLREFTALQNVAMAVQAHAGHSFEFWTPAAREPSLTQPALATLKKVGLADRAQVLAGRLAHGEQRQLELAMALATGPKLLLLDEPMAGMSHLEAESIIALLASLKGRYTILLVEHDMDAVFALADRITVMVYGKAIACGTADEVRGNPQVREAYLGDADADA
jgi:branched-chain amino acid transport system ATP-binding protein